jgi:hypothetical protein
VLVRQVLYCLSHNPFALVVLEIGSHLSPLPVLTVILLLMLPTVAGMTGMHLHAQLFLLRWELVNFSQALALNCHPILTSSCYVGFEFLDSSNPPASASWVTGTTSVYHYADPHPEYLFWCLSQGGEVKRANVSLFW